MDKSKTEKRVCINCGCELEDGEGTAYGIGEICNHCLETEFHHCDNCGRLIHEDDIFYVSNGDVLCSSCSEEYTTICDHCEERVYTSDTVSDGETTVCDDCYDEHYHRCESCDRIISDDDTCWHNDRPYCSYCYDELDSDDEIEEYNYKPTPIFYGKIISWC